MDQPQGVVPHRLGRMGVDARALAGATTIELDRLPKVAGAGEPGVSRALRDTVLAAHEEIAQFGDQFVSTEHLLPGLTASPARGRGRFCGRDSVVTGTKCCRMESS